MALADGAGFAKFAETGAEIAVKYALTLMSGCNDDPRSITVAHVHSWVEGVRQALLDKARDDGYDVKEYSCTLLGAVLEGDTGFFWQIGDGGWVVKTDAGIEVATWPYSGEFVNETVFITSEGAMEKCTIALCEGLEYVLGFSDGIEHLALDYSKKAAHAPFVSRLFGAVGNGISAPGIEQQINQLLNSKLVNDRTDDDKTMLLAWQYDAPEECS